MSIDPTDAGKKPSIHIGEQDSDRAEELGLEGMAPSTVYSKGLESMEKLEELQQKKREIEQAGSRVSLGDLLELWRMIDM